MAILSSFKVTAVLLPAATIGLWIGVLVHAQSNQSDQPTVSRVSQVLPSVYQRWLDEDVRWIITSEERAAFNELSKNEKNDVFVEQFWQRRDPTPDTVRNEYKEEHYRRIAYANEHFAQAIPGWETDRGRVYILYGRPVRIKADPARGLGDRVKPTLQWHYDSIPGYAGVDLIFVDVCRCGDYRLETPLKNW